MPFGKFEYESKLITIPVRLSVFGGPERNRTVMSLLDREVPYQ